MMSSTLVFFVCTLWAVVLATDFSMTSARQKQILNLHNAARAQERTATNMKTMTWDNGLAQQAQAWTDNCQFAHQQDKPWGENLAGEGFSPAYGSTVEKSIPAMFQRWVDEKKYNTGGTFLECCGPSSMACCHYLQVIWANTDKVGCSMSLCSGSVFFACYYSPKGNVMTYDRNRREWLMQPYETA